MELPASASRHLVKGIARAGGGTTVFSNEGEDLRPKVTGLLKNSLQPAISDVKVEWKDAEGATIKYHSMEEEEPEVETRKTLLGYMKPKRGKKQLSIIGPAPSKLPPVYDGQRLLAYCLFSEKGAHTYDVLGCRFPVSFEFPPLPRKPSSVCLTTEFA